ncbi:hypothetical protein [Acinetobacter sp. Ac_5812]|uniref:hypothetical protein n=1 Tax=Acinetobacter sp. Ac_5812 TaxID=1848937 RepID=UPI001490700F|nr:hypothetical protein [Acinetobacter sp. Ac_5812]NNP68893.1 hypothetical protein [Acinetobacter sp. Ac_5812]
MSKNIAIVILGIIFLIQLALNLYLFKFRETPKIHVLDRPLQIASSFDNYSEYTILPAGTVLYDDSDSLNRRVMVYFNLQGVDFNFVDQDADILKQPNEVSAIRAVDLPRVLKSIPLTKKDIFLIIKYDEDINPKVREMLFKKYKIKPSEFESY